jgi:outer membrane protein TolC
MFFPAIPGRIDRARRGRWPARARRAALACLSGAVVFAVGHAAAQEPAQDRPPLGLEAAMDLAEARSMALPARQAAAQAARERAVAAGQRPDPVLRFGMDNVPVEGGSENRFTREPMTAVSIGIVQALPDAAKREARARRFGHDASLALARGEAVRAELRRDTALAWWAVQAEVQRLALLDAQRTEAELLRQSAEAAYRAGRGTQADVFAARAAPARLDDLRLQARARLDNARSSLHRWIGDAANRPLDAAPSLADHALGNDPAPAVLAGDPELSAATAREASARAMADVAREERRTDWSMDLRFSRRGPQFDNMVTVGLSVPLRWDPANRQDRELAARQAETAQAEAETEELRRLRVAEVERWHQRWRSGLARLAGVDETWLPLAAARVQAALAAYRAGSGALNAVLEARQAELALRLERVQIEFETASDWARLNTLMPPSETAP